MPLTVGHVLHAYRPDRDAGRGCGTSGIDLRTAPCPDWCTDCTGWEGPDGIDGRTHRNIVTVHGVLVEFYARETPDGAIDESGADVAGGDHFLSGQQLRDLAGAVFEMADTMDRLGIVPVTHDPHRVRVDGKADRVSVAVTDLASKTLVCPSWCLDAGHHVADPDLWDGNSILHSGPKAQFDAGVGGEVTVWLSRVDLCSDESGGDMLDLGETRDGTVPLVHRQHLDPGRSEAGRDSQPTDRSGGKAPTHERGLGVLAMIRTTAGMSIEDVAEATGFSISYLKRVESDAVPSPRDAWWSRVGSAIADRMVQS